MKDATPEPDRPISFAQARIDRMRGMIHPQTRALHRYFDELRGNRPVPSRAEVDPRDMPCRAANLFILEDLGRGQIRFRLAGSGLTEAFGMELRGLNVRLLMEGRGRESFAALVEEALAEPGIGYARLQRAEVPDEMWEALLLPLRSDAGAIDRVLGSLVPLGAGTVPADRAPMRFVIAEMTIRPIRIDLPAARPAPEEPGLPGFAEGGQTPFAGPGGLTAIEGGRQGASPERPRGTGTPHLRIVRED
jgi:hypothetical protein